MAILNIRRIVIFFRKGLFRLYLSSKICGRFYCFLGPVDLYTNLRISGRISLFSPIFLRALAKVQVLEVLQKLFKVTLSVPRTERYTHIRKGKFYRLTITHVCFWVMSQLCKFVNNRTKLGRIVNTQKPAPPYTIQDHRFRTQFT